MINNMEKEKTSQNAFYTKKIHNDKDFYDEEKKRVVKYINNRYKNDEEYREKRKEYCKLKMRESYQRKKALKNDKVI